jgi:hypothetical protein
MVADHVSVSAACRSRLASELRDTLARVKGVSSPSILRERPDTQDPGTIVAAPAVVLAVQALGAWLAASMPVSRSSFQTEQI